MLVELKDGSIEEIYTDTESYAGCETCDWGSQYINEFKIQMKSGMINIEIDCMYEYALSEGSMMKIILPYVDQIKQMTEDEFFEWIKVKTEEEISENYWSEPENIKIEFNKN